MIRTVRVALLLSVLLTVLVGSAAPALAHGGGTDATSYRSSITDAPAIEGLQWRVYGGDELLWVENLTEEELVVFGYDRTDPDPYLRIGPQGVFENRNAEATWVNREPLGAPVPSAVDVGADPEWVRVSDQPRFLWHDHRIHYADAGMHPQVPDAEGRPSPTQWSVPFSLAGEELMVEGELEWVPGPALWPWLAIGLALSLPALVGLRTQPVGGRWPGLARPAAAVLGVAVVANAVLLVDGLFAVPLPVLAHVAAAAQTALFLGLGAFGAVRGWQARTGAFTALGVGAGALLVGQGLLLAPALTASQLSTVIPEALLRVIVGVNIMQALPLAVVVVVGTRRLLPGLVEAAEQDRPPCSAG